MRKGRLWIAWERQRRSLELARSFGCELAVIEIDGGLSRYLRSAAATIALVARRRPSLLFVQNPSMVLATLACLIGPMLRMPVIVDRHSTLLFGKNIHPLSRRAFWVLHRFTLRHAALTIVTNAGLADLVRTAGGRPVVLPDRIPMLSPASRYPTVDATCLVLPASYCHDEPLDAVLDACRQLPPSVHIYITGNYRKFDPELPRRAPDNVSFTGFLAEQDYVNLLFSADAVLALTMAPYTMLCACYEAIAAGKTLITSDSPVLRQYFDRAIFVENTATSIANGIREFAQTPESFAANSRAMCVELSEKWDALYSAVCRAIEAFE